jgi:riboflavin synthase
LFTGLIVELGEVVSMTRRERGARLLLAAKTVSPQAEIGDSISINGTCLTVVEKKGDTLGFDLSEETLQSSNLGRLRTKDRVNIEPSLRMDSKVGGHFVTGHIDGVGKIESKTLTGEAYKFVINTERRISDFLVEKGSVAVDGISLTVVDVVKGGFSVVIIPHTAKMTTMGSKGAGDSVNIEVDILGKYVSKFLDKGKGSSFLQTLSEEGFA